MATTNKQEPLSKADYVRKRNLFKGTIAVCVLYATIALALLAIIKYTETGKAFVNESNFPFAVTFAFGMIIVIIILVIKIVKFKPTKVKIQQYDDMLCPDFWQLKETDKETLRNMDPEIRASMMYECVKGDGAPDKPNVIINNVSKNAYEKQLAGAFKTMYTDTAVKDQPDKVSMKCNRLFPQYMSMLDNKNNPDAPNDMRCAYSQKCSLPWSAICPDIE